MYIKQRLFAIALMVASAVMIYYGWQRLWSEGVYSLKMAAFSPLVGVGGMFLMVFPTMAGKPNSGREKLVVLAVLVVGLLAGLINWYLMDPGFFGF